MFLSVSEIFHLLSFLGIEIMWGIFVFLISLVTSRVANTFWFGVSLKGIIFLNSKKGTCLYFKDLYKITGFLTNGIFTILFYIGLHDFQNEPTLSDCKNFKTIFNNFYDVKITPKERWWLCLMLKISALDKDEQLLKIWQSGLLENKLRRTYPYPSLWCLEDLLCQL